MKASEIKDTDQQFLKLPRNLGM